MAKRIPLLSACQKYVKITEGKTMTRPDRGFDVFQPWVYITVLFIIALAIGIWAA